MKHASTRTIRFTRKPLAAAVALAIAAPGLAVAEPLLQVPLYGNADMTRYSTNNVELGVMYNSDDSYKFGEFTGLNEDGLYAIGNFNVQKNFGGDDRNYIDASGWNLGLDSRQIAGEVGTQGKYYVNVGYDQLTRYQFDDTRFIHDGLGGSLLTLPAAFPGTGNPPAAAAVDPFLKPYNIEQERDVLKLGGGFFLGSNWKFDLNYRQDKRDGTRLIGSVIGNSGGNPRAAILPYELNDKTDQLEFTASYFTPKAQLNLSYYYSKYSNDAGCSTPGNLVPGSGSCLTWQNPYLGAGGPWGGSNAVVGYPAATGFGRLGLAPDNDYHQFQATGGWNFSSTTRMNATLAYGWAKQDEAFSPYTVNPALATPVPLPRASLDGEIKNTLFDVNLITRPLPKMTLKANYHYNQHDNNTPQASYLYVGGDSQPQKAAIDARINLPPGSKENKFKLDGDYEIMPRTLLRAWYEYKKVDYEEASEELRSDTDNNQFAVELRRVASEMFTGSVRYQYDRRRGSDFDQNRPYRASYTAAAVAASRFDNLPTLRQYYVADYDQDTIKAMGMFMPMDTVSLQASVDWYSRDYKGPDCGGPADQAPLSTPTVVVPGAAFPAECLGLQEADGQSYTLDAQWTPLPGVSTFAFYTYADTKNKQYSRSYNGNPLATKVTQSTDPTRNWNADLKYEDNTVGLGASYQPDHKKWELGVQYIYSEGKSKTSLAAGTAITPAGGIVQPPDAKSELNTFQIFGKYRYSKNILVRANYWYEKLDWSDWAYDNATATSAQRVILTGQGTPDYDNHVFGISVAYENW